MTRKELEKFVAENSDIVHWSDISSDVIVIDSEEYVLHAISIFGNEPNLYCSSWRIDSHHRIRETSEALYTMYKADTIRKLKWLVKKLASL